MFTRVHIDGFQGDGPRDIPLSEPQLLTWEGACSIGRRRDILVTGEDIDAESIFQTQEDCRSANPGKS